MRTCRRRRKPQPSWEHREYRHSHDVPKTFATRSIRTSAMPKDTPAQRQQMRLRIAHLAARMIAEDGISDYGLAKRKAARQAGAPDSRNLPTNLEIEDALRSYQALYQADTHPEQVQYMRELALEMMQILEPFDPHLTGPVLSGNVGPHAEIHLHLYTD